MMYGIDISNWQEGLEIDRLPANVRFVICKVTEGTSFTDWTAKKFIHNTVTTNRKYGFYHFAQGMNPEMEAEWFVMNSHGYFNHGIPILDYEIDSHYGGMNESEWCEAFMKRVHELTGCWCMLYTYASKLKSFMNAEWLYEKCPLWLAGYPGDYSEYIDTVPPYHVAPWEIATIWQFTSNLRFSCYDGSIDGDIAYMDEDEWKDYCGGDSMNGQEIAQAVWGYNYENTIRGGETIYDEVAAIYDMVLDILEEVEDLKECIENGKC